MFSQENVVQQGINALSSVAGCLKNQRDHEKFDEDISDVKSGVSMDARVYNLFAKSDINGWAAAPIL